MTENPPRFQEDLEMRNAEVPCVVSVLSFQLCLHFPDPRPTGPLKMQKVQGDGMFNAWSALLPLGPLLLSQDGVCADTLFGDRTAAVAGAKRQHTR